MMMRQKSKLIEESPLFSIVIPTRNRADLLVNSALKSVLSQDFEDFEVVICDNASTDNTGTLVKGIKDKRVRYIHSPTWIPKVDFCESSLNYAKGKFSLLFFDDDVLISGALDKCHKLLSNFDTNILTFPNTAVYHFPDWHEPKKRNLLTIPACSNEVYIKNARTHLQKIFAHRALIPGTPDVTNSFYKTSFIQELIKRYGTLLPHGHMGDYDIACHVLANTEYFLHCDSPVAIFGQWSQNTSQQLRDLKTTRPEYQEWIAWATENLLSDMPFKSYLFSNCISATLLDTQKRLNLPWTIDWTGYFDDIRRDIKRLKKIGIDVSQLQKEYDLAIRNHSDIRKVTGHAQTSEQNLIGRVPLRFKGEKHNFSDILSAGDFFTYAQSQRAKVAPDQLKLLHNSMVILRLCSKCARILLGRRAYERARRYIQILARAITGVGN